MDFIDVQGLTTHYDVRGSSDGTPLVLLHSLGTDLRIWDAVAVALSDEYRVIRYDLRGHGLSDSPTPPYTTRDFTGDLVGLLDQLGIEQAVVVGISVGGLIAMDCALTHPDRVRALVLCDTGAKIGAIEAWDERITTVQQHGMTQIAEIVLARWFTAEFAQRQAAAHRGYANMLVRTPAAGYIGTCAALRDTDLSDQIENITARTLVICGAQDVSTPVTQARELVAAIPSARFAEITDAAHLPCIEQPDAVAEAIRDFLKELTDER